MAHKQRDIKLITKSLFAYLASGVVGEGYSVLRDYGDPLVTSGIYMVANDPDDPSEFTTPAIAVGLNYLKSKPLQLGPGHIKANTYVATVYGRSRSERDDMASMVWDILESGFVDIWNYNIIDTGGTYISLATGKPDNFTVAPKKFDSTRTELKNAMEVIFDLDVDICSGISLIS